MHGTGQPFFCDLFPLGHMYLFELFPLGEKNPSRSIRSLLNKSLTQNSRPLPFKLQLALSIYWRIKNAKFYIEGIVQWKLRNTCYRNKQNEAYIFSRKIKRIRVKIGERGMICSFICMLDLVMFEFDIIPYIVSDLKHLVIF